MKHTHWLHLLAAGLVILVSNLQVQSATATRPGIASSQAAPRSRQTPQSFRFAAITDTHIATPDQLARFRQFLYTIRDEKPDFLLILGDICGQAPEDLPQIREIIDHSGLTVYTVPGNHDDNYGRNSEWYTAAFPKAYYSFEHKGWHFVMADSQLIVDAKDAAPLAWLRDELASQPTGTPIIFCQHYPPRQASPGQQGESPDPCAQVAASPDVKIVLAGHEHRRATYPIGKTRCEVLGSCFFALDSRDAAKYYVIETAADGEVRIQQRDLASLDLREPADHLPTVQIDSPADGAVLQGPATFTGTAADDRAVTTVEYSVDFGGWRKADLDEPNHWLFAADTRTLTDSHHMFRVRAIDSAGQPSIAMGNALVLVENAPPTGKCVYRFQQGRDGYQGCRDVTVRKTRSAKAATGEDGQTGDLECWLSRTARGDLREFNEFYIRFDLSKAGIPADAKVKRAKLTLYGSRQNQVDPAGKQCRYHVAALDEDWRPDMTFARRPGRPAWAAATRPQPSPAIEGSWPYLGGTQQIVPPREVVVDLTPLKGRVESWLRDPASNHGLVFSPGAGRSYNMSVKGSTCPIVTLRPRLQIEIEPSTSTAAEPADKP